MKVAQQVLHSFISHLKIPPVMPSRVQSSNKFLTSSAMHTNTILMQNFVLHIAMNGQLKCTPALSTFTS